jgi:hypothetical protein
VSPPRLRHCFPELAYEVTNLAPLNRYHFTVEYFEDLRNVNHCEFVVMNLNNDSGKYVLENKLRTWSELKRERAIAEGRTLDVQPEEHSLSARRKWGGCPQGCDHAKFKISLKRRRENTVEFGQKDTIVLENAALHHRQPSGKGGENTRSVHPQSPVFSDNPRGRAGGSKSNSKKVEENAITSPHGMHPYLQRLDSPYRLSVLQVGRDFGGSRSGVASRDGSYSSGSDNEDGPEKNEKNSFAVDLDMGLASALGDRRGAGIEDENGALEEAEAIDKSLQGSVY